SGGRGYDGVVRRLRLGHVFRVVHNVFELRLMRARQEGDVYAPQVDGDDEHLCPAARRVGVEQRLVEPRVVLGPARVDDGHPHAVTPGRPFLVEGTWVHRPERAQGGLLRDHGRAHGTRARSGQRGGDGPVRLGRLVLAADAVAAILDRVDEIFEPGA